MSVSKKDELRVRLGNKRVARIKEQALIPVKPLSDKDKERKARLLSLSTFGQEKPELVYEDKAIILCAGKVRSSADKLARDFRRNGDNFSDYADNDLLPLQKAKQPFVTPRANSPFKRDGKRMTPVVTHKK